MDNNIVITSHTGALMVTEAGKTTELEAGGSSSRTADPTPAPAPAPQAAPVFPGSSLSGKQVFAIAAVVAGAAVATGLWSGMNAAGIPPGGFGNNAVSSHQGRSMNHAMRTAAAVASPVLAGVSNSARINTASHVAQQHRNIRAGR